MGQAALRNRCQDAVNCERYVPSSSRWLVRGPLSVVGGDQAERRGHGAKRERVLGPLSVVLIPGLGLEYPGPDADDSRREHTL